MRLALGASRWALVRALMVESLALGAVGVVLALVVMTWATGVLVSGLSRAVPGTALDVSFDWRVLVFASIAGSVSAMLFGVVPAFRATRLAPVSILHAEGRGPSDGVRVGAMNVVLAAQTAITLVLVLNAGLFIRTFQELTRVPLGFDPEGLLSVTVSAPYTAPADRNRLYHRLVEVASTVPGVAQAGGGLSEPLRRVGVPIALTVSGAQPLAYAESLSYADDVTPGWRRAYGLHLRAGRDIDGRDVVGAEQVVVVNETFVQRFFPGENILGRTLSLTAHVPPDGEIDVGDRVVIGIVADAAHDSVRGAKRPIIYRPLAQRDGPLFIAFHLLVRSAALSTGRLADEVTGALRGVNPALRMTLRPMAETVDAVLAEDRLLTHVSTFAAGLSLLLAAIGLYGLTAYSVACRRAEIAVRLALGGVPRSILRLVLLQLVRLLAVGVSVGLAMSLWASQFLSSLLYGVSARNPVVMVGGVIMLVVTAVAAAFLPAYRASLGDPAIALRDT